MVFAVMFNRNANDLKILEEANTGIDEIRKWIIDLFYGRGVLNFTFTSDVFDWWLETVLENYEAAEDKKIRRMILNKIIHTKEVVEAGLDIMTRTGEVDWDPFMVCTVCLLHDIGRFKQALLGSYSDIKTNFDHAEIGAVMIEKKSLPEMELMGLNKSEVVEAVRMHSRINYNGSNVYAKLVRDADKLALLRFMPFLLDDERFPRKGANKNALEAYMNGKMVSHKDMISREDVFLTWLSWQTDFNYSATRESFVDEGIKDWMLGQLRNDGVNV